MSGRAAGDASAPSVSIVIPVYNEIGTLPRLLDQLDELGVAAAGAGCEVVVVDGGSTDGTPDAVRPPYRLVRCGQRGRARALNAGAQAAGGEILFFLHSDSVLPRDPLGEIRRIARRRRAGCFGIRFDRRSPVLLLCRWLSNLRVALRNLAYGDQGLFIERALFFELGMFPDQPLMEDLEFSLRLKERGVRLGLARRRITTSARRFSGGERAALRIWLDMVELRRLYRAGVAPEELARRYRDVR